MSVAEGRADGPVTPRYARWLSLAAFATFAALVTVDLGGREFWTDEVSTAGHTEALRRVQQPSHPPGYFLLLYGWRQVFGGSDLSLRAFSVPWALLCFVVLSAVARRVLSTTGVVLAQWLFALSPFVILYFRMARYYSMATALALLVLYCTLLVLQEGRWRHWIGLGSSAAALLWTNYIVTAMFAPLLGIAAWRAWRSRRLIRLLVALALPAIVFGLLCHSMLSGAATYQSPEGGGRPSLGRSLVMGLAVPLYCILVGETTEPWRFLLVIPACLAGGGLLLLGLLRADREGGGRVVAWVWPPALVIMALAWSVVGTASPTGVTRYGLMAAPLAYITLVAGALSLRGRWLVIGLLVIVLATDVYGLRNYFTGQQFLNPSYVVPWREVARAIEAQEQPGDTVFGFYEGGLSRYGQFRRLIVGNEEEPESLAFLDRWPEGKGRLWLVTRHRGSAGALRLADDTLAKLRPRAARVETLKFGAISPVSRAWQERLLGRSIPDAIVTVYLLVPR